MTTANPLKATFFAFKKRDKNGVLFGASVGFVVVMILALIALFAGMWALLGPAAIGAASGTMQSADVGRALLILPLYVGFLVLFFVIIAAYEASCLRWMIRGQSGGFLGLTFGADMWRVYGTYWAWFFYGLLGWLVFVVVMGVAGFAAGATNDAGLAGIISLAVGCAYLLLWFYVTVRLAPAAATSVGTQRFAPLEAWKTSRGRFWALFGSYFLLFIVYLVIAFGITLALFGSTYLQMFSQVDWSSMSTNPQAFSQSYERANLQMMQNMFGSASLIAIYVAAQIVLNVIGLVFYVLLYGVSARAVLAAAEDGKIDGIQTPAIAGQFD